MEGGAGTAMEVVVQNLINVTKEEISLIRGLDNEAQQLKMTLTTIQGYLNDAEKYITQDSVKNWLQQLEEVAFHADNVLDELSYHALHNKVKAIKTMTDKAFSCFSSFHHTLRPLHMAHRIKEINSSFNSITKTANDLHLQSIIVNASPSVPDFALETDSYTLDPIFIGRDDDVPKLVKALTEEERIITILAVVGMGGLGKTTLTRKVFNHQNIQTRFGCHSWVYVSRTFDSLIIFKKFLASLPSQTNEDKSREENGNEPNRQKSFKAKNDEVETRQDILKKLQAALKNKTYLLVLDDVWNEETSKWEDFILALSGITSTKGNGIIITTRSTDVASKMNPLQTHHLSGLSEEECWSIIKAKAFQVENVIASEFETMGKKIARRCQGLPLAAQVVGGVLRRKSEQEWLSVEQKWVEGDDISKILKLSYDNLSSASLKKCFAYCSIFPKGQRMRKQELIELWMAEGFLQPDERNDMESVGEKFLKVLLHSSLFQLAPRNDDEEEMCVMHDHVHDLAILVKGCLKVRYMRRHGDESSHIPKESAKYLRTLFFEGKISEFKSSDFKCLHALSFGGEGVQFRLLQLGKLIHLRRLDISETKIEYLPDSIGELHHLQTLRADNKWYFKKLPRTMKYLISLRHLYIHDYVKTPPELGRLTSLQTLSHFNVGHTKGRQIEEIGNLKNLKGKLKIFNLEEVQGKEEAQKAKIFQNPNYLELSFRWEEVRGGEQINDENVLEGLQPHSNLRKLEIHGFRGKTFPLWSAKMEVRDVAQGFWVVLNNLVEIRLVKCEECEEIPTLGHLPNLKHLYLKDLIKVKSIKSSFYGIDNIGVWQETISVFPVLERLEVHIMPELGEWAEIEFSKPRSHDVKVFPLLQYLKIDECRRLECLPDRLFHDSQHLSKLSIEYCTQLRELPDGLHTLNSLEELTILGCQNLKSIGNPSGQSQGTLRELRIKFCEGLMELPHEMVESWAASLERVELIYLSSLKNLPKVIECLTNSTGLRELSIVGVPKFMATPSVESWALDSLSALSIDVSVEWSRESSDAIQDTLDRILQRCNPHSLTYLELSGLEIWECLPQSIQHFTALLDLYLSNFGIEELPQWFGNLSSLERLNLYKCKKLRRLGGNDALGTKLEYLEIGDCPELHIDWEWRRNKNLYIEVDDYEIPSLPQ